VVFLLISDERACLVAANKYGRLLWCDDTSMVVVHGFVNSGWGNDTIGNKSSHLSAGSVIFRSSGGGRCSICIAKMTRYRLLQGPPALAHQRRRM
jgi:hypothetical protein